MDADPVETPRTIEDPPPLDYHADLRSTLHYVVVLVLFVLLSCKWIGLDLNGF